MERLVEDGSLDDNVESFLSHDDNDLRDNVVRGMDVSQGAQIETCFIVTICIGFPRELWLSDFLFISQF